jgi:hypothetical protein
VTVHDEMQPTPTHVWSAVGLQSLQAAKREQSEVCTAAALELAPVALLEFKREVFSKYQEDWHGHLGVKWRREDHFNVIVRLMARLDECPNPSETGYCACAECYETAVYNWCLDTLDDICWSLAVYKANMKMPLGQAMKLKPRRKDCKPMEYEEHNGRLYIKIPAPPRHSEPFLVWVIDADWKDWCEAVWPVYLKKDYRLGWYLAKSTSRQLRDGSWLPCDVSVAHLFCSCLHGESVCPADGSMLNYTDGNLIRVDNVEKDTTDPDKLPRAFQLGLDIAGLDQWRPPKKTNTSHKDTGDEHEEGSLKGHFSAGQVSAQWGLGRIVEAEGESRVVSSPTQKGLNRKYRKAEDGAVQAETAKRSAEVERVMTEEGRKAMQEQMNAVWAQATSHLAPESAQT